MKTLLLVHEHIGELYCNLRVGETFLILTENQEVIKGKIFQHGMKTPEAKPKDK